MSFTKYLGLTILVLLLAGLGEAKTTVTKSDGGKLPDGSSVELYTLSDGPHEARIATYGAVLVSFKTPDKSGKAADVILGFDDAAGFYENFNGSHNAFFDAIIGRYANRIGKASFTLEGKQYELPKNDGPNTLHSGTHGFNNQLWQGKQVADGVELTYVSKDGENGFPGTLTATVKYTLKGGDLRIEYTAKTDKPTVVNLTNHSYFNLAGEGSGEILKHQLTLHASKFTPVDATLIPTGELKSVDGTPFDFRKSTEIGARINNDDEQLKLGRGYDHNWVLDSSGKLAVAAEVYEPTSGRVLKVLTDQPGIQFYSGNFLDGSVKGKGGKSYAHRTGLCLETQHFPDSPNHTNFPTTELKPGQTYHTVTVFSFSTRK